ncbi:hypothetical protein ACTA71_000308 [Dictyostelium dimigraforme]
MNLEFICLDCKSIPCCSQCITSGGKHYIHVIVLLESITKSEILSITNIFKEVIPKVIEIFEIDKQTLKDSDNRFKKIQSQYNENKKLVTEQFNKIHRIIQIIQTDIEKQLETVYQDNTIINTTITSSINDDNHKNGPIIDNLNNIKQNINNIQQNFNNNNNNNYDINHSNNQDLMELISQYQHSSLILNNDNNINNFNKLKEYKNQIIKFNHQQIVDIQNNLNLIYNIDRLNENYSIEIDKNKNKYIKENQKFPKNEDSVALGEDCGSLSELKSITNLIFVKLLDGFDERLEVLPNGIEYLDIYDIKTPLEVGSIPSTVRDLSLCNGYNQSIKPGVIPSSVKNLYLWDIKQPLEVGSIPSTVGGLSLHDGYNQSIKPGVIPSSVKYLHLYDIKQPLEVGSIPSTVERLSLHDGYNQSIKPGVIPSSVKYLHLHDIKQPLEVGSVPSTVEDLSLHSRYNQSIKPGVIPSGVKYLHLYDIKQPLEVNSIPASVTSITLDYGFGQPLTPGIIPNSIKQLTLGLINTQLIEGSIPKNIPKIILRNGFKQSLDICKLNESVQILR